jgi:hypothetical protein
MNGMVLPPAFFALFSAYAVLGIADSLRLPASMALFVEEGEHFDAQHRVGTEEREERRREQQSAHQAQGHRGEDGSGELRQRDRGGADGVHERPGEHEVVAVADAVGEVPHVPLRERLR